MATQVVPHPNWNRHLLWNVALWILQIGLAFVFLNAGTAKLTGNPMMVKIFSTIGIGQWFRYLTGSLEIIGAAGLFIPRLAGYAALLLSAVMAGAILSHLTVLGGSPLMPVVLLAANLVVVWGRLERRV